MASSAARDDDARLAEGEARLARGDPAGGVLLDEVEARGGALGARPPHRRHGPQCPHPRPRRRRSQAPALPAHARRALGRDPVIAVDSSRTCAECGHVDARNRSGEKFQCTWCGHTDHADTNAARVVRARTARWLVLREVHQSDARAHEALRSIVYQMRRASKVRALVAREKLPRAGKTREGARTKPRVEGAVGNTQHNGAKGVASSAPRLRDHARSGSQSSTTAEPAVRHAQRSQRSV